MLYICVYIYIYMFAKLHFVGYYLSTTTSQEKEHSSMQKYENKDVCVKHGLGVTAVPSQPAPAGSSCSQGQQGPLGSARLELLLPLQKKVCWLPVQHLPLLGMFPSCCQAEQALAQARASLFVRCLAGVYGVSGEA